MDKWERKKAQKRLEYLNKFIKETFQEIKEIEETTLPLRDKTIEAINEAKKLELELEDG